MGESTKAASDGLRDESHITAIATQAASRRMKQNLAQSSLLGADGAARAPRLPSRMSLPRLS
jgi:hypothetical protein